MRDKPHDKPSEVEAQAGAVQVRGPSDVAVTFTPEAALDTAQRLTEAACEAKGNQSLHE